MCIRYGENPNCEPWKAATQLINYEFHVLHSILYFHFFSAVVQFGVRFAGKPAFSESHRPADLDEVEFSCVYVCML